MDTKATTSSGMGLGGVLLVTFVVLKLTHLVEWSWLWVLSPLWIPMVFVLLILGCFAVTALFIAMRK